MTTPTAFYLVGDGVNLINNAATGIPTIRISQFKLGSQVNYQPESTDHDIRGTLVYQGTITSVTQFDHDTIRVTIQLPPNVGPFSFGEVGLYTDAGVLVALCSYPVLQNKLEVTTSGIVNPWTISALIQATQGTGIFFLSNAVSPIVPEFPDFSYVTQPSGMVGQPNVIVVREGTADGQPITLVANSTDWSPIDWTPIATVVPSFVDPDSLSFPGIDQLDGSTSGRYLLSDGLGNLITIQSIYLSTALLPRIVTWLYVTNSYTLYEKTSYRTGKSAISVSDANGFVSQINKVWSAPTGTVATGPSRFGINDSALPYYGYGQPAVSNLTDVTDPLEWQGFIEALTSTATLLGLPIPVNLTGFSAQALSAYNNEYQLDTIKSLLSQITTSRLRIPTKNLEYSAFVNQILATTNNNRIHYNVTATFADQPSEYAYFNSGGSICFQLEDGISNLPAQTYTEYMTRSILSQLGTIRFHGLACESLGQLKVKGRNSFSLSPSGPSYRGNRNPGIGYSSESFLGFYSLSVGQRAEVFSYVVPLGTDGGSAAGSQILEIGIYATRTTASVIMLECWVNILAYSDYAAGNFTVSTPRQTTITVYAARASSSYMSVNYPTLVADATNW